MKILCSAAIALLAVSALVILVFHIRSRRPLRSFFINALLGVGTVIVINLTTRFTGVHIPANWFSVGGAGIFGMPAALALIILQMLI